MWFVSSTIVFCTQNERVLDFTLLYFTKINEVKTVCGRIFVINGFTIIIDKL